MFENNALMNEAPNLRKFALRLTRNVSDADDLLQSTLLRALEKKHLFLEGSDLFKWTSKMMFNLFVTGYRQKTKFESQYDPETLLANESVEANQEYTTDLRKVRLAMAQLSHDHRQILTLVCIQGLRYEEVANFLEIPVGTVRSRLSRARDALAAMMETSDVVGAAAMRARDTAGSRSGYAADRHMRAANRLAA